MLDTILTVPVRNWTVSSGPIPIGYKGESKVTTIVFDFNTELVDAVYTLEIEGEFKAFKILQRDGNRLSLTVERDLTAGNLTGLVDLQLVATAEGAVVKTSNIFPGRIYPSINAGDEFPEAEVSEFQKALSDYNAKLQQAIDAAESAQASAAESSESASEARSAEIGATMAANAANLSHKDAEAAKEAAERAKVGTARDAVIASDFANKAEYAKVDAQESARKAQTSATESARHASESASSAELAGRSVEAIRGMSADAETLEPGSEATASYDINANRLHFGIPKGEKGDAGERGADGIDGTNGRDGRDGVDGRTPVKGTDYFTPSDVEEIVQETIGRVPTYDDTEIKSDIENLESKKVGYSEVVNGQLLMYTNSTKSTLLAALDLPAAPVQDVQVAGESKVVNGVADIPIANGWNKLGLVKFTGTASGIGQVNGSPETIEISEEQIDARTDSHRVVTARRIPYAVKSAMSAPISATDPEWSDAEKIAARQRMGLEKEWTLVESFNCDGEDRGNVDTRARVDLTGYTELLVKTKITATGNVNLENPSFVMASSIGFNGSRMCELYFMDGFDGYRAVFARRINSLNGLYYDTSVQTYEPNNNLFIKNIKTLWLGGSANILFCDVKIYAR